LNWIKKKSIKVVLRQERVLLKMHVSLMKGFDPLQTLTTVYLFNKCSASTNLFQFITKATFLVFI